MFSIQFCVCFHMILNVCHCHFSGNIYENCTKTINLVPKNEDKATITEKNDTTEENHGKNVANTSAGINRKDVKAIEKTNRVIDIDEGTEKLQMKENYSLSEMGVTLFDLDIPENKKTNIPFNRSQEEVDHKKQSDITKDIGKLTVTKEDIVERVRTKIVNESLTKIVNKDEEKNDTDKNVQKYDPLIKNKNYKLHKNVESETMPKNVNYLLQNNSKDQNVQTYYLPKKENTENVKIQTITETETKLFDSNGTNQNGLKYDLPKKENNNLHKNVLIQTMTKNKTKLFEINRTDEDNNELHKKGKTETIIVNVNITLQDNTTDKNVLKYDLPNKENNDLNKNYKSETMTENETKLFGNNSTVHNVHKYGLSKKENSNLHKNFKNETITENMNIILQNNSTDQNVLKCDLPKNDNNDMNKNNQKYDSPKNVQKRDIPENVSSDKMPKVFPNNEATKYQKFNSHDKNENHDKNTHYDNTVKKIKHHNKHVYNANDDELYNYQNYEMNYKKIIDKNEHYKKNHNGRYDDNVSHKILPQIQTRLDNDLVKKSLDEFKMVRRKTHYTMPPIDFKDEDSTPDIDRYQDLVYNHEYNDNDKVERTKAVRNNADSEYNTENNQNNAYETYDDRNYQSYEEPDMPNFKQLNHLLARQKEIVSQLAQIQLIGRNKDVAFYDLLDEVKAKQEDYKTWKNYTKFSFEKPTTKPTTIKTSTAKPTTVVTVFDETEIRRALKNDPQIKRILKLANMKRKKYLDNVRNYLIKNNYVHDKEYAKKLSESHTDVNRAKFSENTNLNNKV